MNFNKTATDDQLVFSLKQGEEGAFTEIYSRYSAKLLAIAFNYCRHPNLAEEIVQEIFMSLWERRKSLEIKSLNAYLGTAVRFSVFKQIYARKKREELAKENYKIETTVIEEDKIYAKFLDEYIRGIVDTLPQKCRLVFRYSRDLHMTNKEIAKEMNISEKTVESHMTKALKTIRKNLTNSSAHTLLIYSFLEFISK